MKVKLYLSLMAILGFVVTCFGQSSDKITYDFRDGIIVTGGQSADGSLKLSGTYSYHSSIYGLNMKAGAQVKIAVAGGCTVRFLGSAYSSLSISGETSGGTALDPAVQSTQVASDLNDSYEFAYSGDADTLVFTATGDGSDIYLPLILVIQGEVNTKEWKKKSGTITINGVEVGLTAGENSSSDAEIILSAGTVRRINADEAVIETDLGGAALSSYTPAFSGEIASVSVSNDTLIVSYSNEGTLPANFNIIVVDNSIEVTAEPGKTYNYNFVDGSELPQNTTIMYSDFYTNDEIVSIKSNGAKEFWYHDPTHGVVFYSGNSIEMKVAGDAIITFITCTYSAAGSVFTFTDSEGTVLGSCAADNNGGADAYAVSFSYSGAAGVIKATLSSEGSVYIHGMAIENAPAVEPSNGKIDVWDFGAEQLDTTVYKNNLTVDVINSWYDGSVTVGSAGNVLPNFSAGILSWVGGGNDRLRTSNTALTRYDENLGSVAGYTGRVYVNSGAATGRYMSLTLSEDDEVTLCVITQNGGGHIHFENVADPEYQNDEVIVTSNGTTAQEVKFVAKAAGTYHIYDSQDKPSYYRICRKDANYIAVTGNIDETQALGIPENYAIQFTNEAGKKFTATKNETGYSVNLPSGYGYELSLVDANGFIISVGKELNVTDTTSTHNISIQKVELYEVSGAVAGLGDEIGNLGLAFTPDSALAKIYVPEPAVDAENSTYSVMLEPNCRYIISATGVNDYDILVDTILISNAVATSDIVFEPKPVYHVTINTTGLTAEQRKNLGLVFTNMNEEGYIYSFASIDSIELRDGTYSISYNGVDDYPVELGLTSNLTVSGTGTSKDIAFGRVTNWPFNDKVIANGDPSYKGLLFTGIVYNEVAKGHLATKPDATIQVPVMAGEKVIVSYYYSADFSIDGGDPVTTSSGSTSMIESSEYIYNGAGSGTVTITVGADAGTTYFTNIEVVDIIELKSVITVGADKDFQTINEALAAIREMNRPNNERVTVMIDPGNYEEMLVVDVPNVSLENASTQPDIALFNKGVDISDNAVRITSYYGHGYSYFSMGDNQQWNADILKVNKENGYLSYVNKGSGTTNGSYWNATVVVSAPGFEAHHVIFENSFNQYISRKESEDVVVMWEVGNKGERPTDYGNTAVQDRSFVERAAAIAITASADKVVLNKCRVVGRQDSYYGAGPARVVMYKGAMMGAVDYIFGAMVAVFYKSDLVMNTSDASTDVSYVTAAQHSSGRGYLMYECKVTSPEPGVETASAYRSKPGYFGRPWQAETSEVVFYNTTVDTSDFPGSEGKSLISPTGWSSSLGGESNKMYEFGTVEESEENNQSNRVSWSTVLTEPRLSDGTEITTYNFTKGDDGWDPLPVLIASDSETAVNTIPAAASSAKVYAGNEKLHVVNVTSETQIRVYNLCGSLMQIHEVGADTVFPSKQGVWIIQIVDDSGLSVSKVFVK